MNATKTFEEKSYQRHSDHYKEFSNNGKNSELAKSWFNTDTVDAWRHHQMYKVLDPILTAEPHAKWLTVGDGRYGSEANYITKKGVFALATDISEHLLKEAKSIGFIQEYKVENAESLSFQDSTFDYVFCKESYHHFPRPMLALYEMLRVAKSGVLLIEPNDVFIHDRFSTIMFQGFKNSVKYVLGKKINRHRFEAIGNYIFTISKRELEKVALGLNYRMVAFKGINDAYIKGVEYEKLSDNGPLQKKLLRKIRIANMLCKIGLCKHNILVSIIFKKEPTPELLKQLTNDGYEIIQLPNNIQISD